MKIGKLVQGFRGWLDHSGHTSNETNWSDELIYDHMLKFRAAYLAEKLKNLDSIAYDSYRVIPCIKLVKVDRNECPCAPLSGCSFRKTEIPVIRNIHIRSITSVDGTIKYDYIPWESFEDVMNDRISAMREFGFFTYKTIGDKTYHYLHNDNHKRTITETLIPYDPIEYAQMPDCMGVVNSCLDAYDIEFPMDPDLEARLNTEVFATLVQPRPKETDSFNNGMYDAGLPLK